MLASDELLAARGVTLHEINRGGDVTYHGPGQLVGYPIFDLRSLRNPNGGRMGPVDFVRQMEEALIRLCAVYGVPAGRIAGLTGVWCSVTEPQVSSKESKKIGAIGIHVSRGITSHGFAFNVTTNLDDFSLINPCGITDRPVTSLEREMADPARVPALESIAHQAARQFGIVFGEQILAVESLDALRAQAGAPNAAAAAPKTRLCRFRQRWRGCGETSSVQFGREPARRPSDASFNCIRVPLNRCRVFVRSALPASAAGPRFIIRQEPGASRGL